MKDWTDYKNDKEKLLRFLRKPENKSSAKPIKTSGFFKLTTSSHTSSNSNDTTDFNIATNVIAELNVSQETVNVPSNIGERKLVKVK